MELNKKCLDLMARLRQEQDFVTVEKLAETYGVSVRGIRYSLDKIEQYMSLHGMPYLDRERRLGVRLLPDAAVYDFVDRCAGRLVPFQYNYSAEERQAYLRAALLLAVRPAKVEDFCHALDRSRNTVLKDLELAETWLAASGMTLIKKPRTGMLTEGAEEARRDLLTELLLDGIPGDDLLRYTMERETLSKASCLLLELLSPLPQARLINRAIRHMQGILERQFSDESFSSLVICLAILLRRAAAGKSLPASSEEGDLPLSNEYSAAKPVLRELERQTEIHIPENEIIYFTHHLLGAKVLKPDLADILPEERDVLRGITERMVAELEEIYQVTFGDGREDVVQGVLLHLRPAVHRIRYGLYNKNPLYHEIVSNYNALFINTRIVCQHLEKHVGRPINDHEVAYIALHFGAALHRINKRTSTRARVLLVCGTGLGSAKMIESQIQSLYNVEVVDTVSGREAADMDKRGVDYVITTVPIPEEAGCRYIRVSPMFTEKDQHTVGQYLSVRYTPKERYDLEVSTANRLISIVEKYCVVTDRLHLQYELLSELMNNNRLDMTRRPDEYRLCDLLTKDRVSVDVPCHNWRESIALSAGVLEQQGVVLPGYKDAIVRALEEYGPYMVMIPGVALAHAAAEDGVLGLGMSMVVLREPVNFGNPENDPVRVVVSLAAVDDKQHLKALAQLFRMFKDPESEAIVFSGNRDGVLEQIAMHSY